MAILPQAFRQPHARACCATTCACARWRSALGLIPPRTMHSEQDARVLLEAARGARRVVEIGVYEGASAVALCATLEPGAELHLIDPFGAHPDALPSGWGASEWATRRAVARARRRRGRDAPRVRWHVAASRTRSPRAGRERSTCCSSTAITPRRAASSTGPAGRAFWRPAGASVFHDARAGQSRGARAARPDGGRLAAFRGGGHAGAGRSSAEADRTVVVGQRA